jgi:hypothetical protein
MAFLADLAEIREKANNWQATLVSAAIPGSQLAAAATSDVGNATSLLKEPANKSSPTVAEDIAVADAAVAAIVHDTASTIGGQVGLQQSALQPCSPNHVRCPAPVCGIWVISDRQSATDFEKMWVEMGYPSFIRLCVTRLMSSLLISDDGEGITFQPNGKLLDQTMPNYSCEIPRMVIRRPGTAITDRGLRFELVACDCGATCIGKLGCRFTDRHNTLVHADGRCISEHLCYDPKCFFSAEGTSTQSMSSVGIKSWVDHLYDVDETGLPKQMAHGHWDRRVLEVKASVDDDGVSSLSTSVKVYEYDKATASWSRLRTSANFSYILS